MVIAMRAVTPNHAMLRWPFGSTMNAASSGPIADTGVAADLEERLREAVPAARRHPRHARRLGVEDRRSDAHARRGHSTTRNDGAKASSTSPVRVNAMPMASEYGFGALSVK
jgi:hypothetical protein